MLAEHEEEFMEYEKAVKETMSKKDEAIERLNIVIEGLRAKINTKELGGSLREVLVDSHLH